MKKLVTFLFIVGFLIVFLLMVAFLYMDLSGHKVFKYELIKDDKTFASILVDRYVIEDKIIYKSNGEYPYSLGYPEVFKELFLKKKNLNPLKFIVERKGIKGQKNVTMLTHEEGRADYLYLDHPRSVVFSDIETGFNIIFFSTKDIVLYMAVMEKYNFWKKGSQYFEALIPVSNNTPPVETKLEIKYVKDEYIPVLGKRVEAEEFIIKGNIIPDVKIFLSKYTHRILLLEIEGKEEKYILTEFLDGPLKRIEYFADNVKTFFMPKIYDAEKMEATKVFPGSVSASTMKTKKTAEVGDDKAYRVKEVFFESGNNFLSGKLWIPNKGHSFPAVILVPRDGSETRGEQYLMESLAETFAVSGFSALTFDSPGQGKSQGSFKSVDDDRRVQDLTSAFVYLEKNPNISKENITFIGHEGGGYIAVKTASKLPSVRGCVLVNPPLKYDGVDFYEQVPNENLRGILSEQDIGSFKDVFIEKMSWETYQQMKSAVESNKSFYLFKGKKIPLASYREFLMRNMNEAVLEFDRPVLLIFNKGSRYFTQKAVDSIKKQLRKRNSNNRLVVMKEMGEYVGEILPYTEGWYFSSNPEALELVGSWVFEINLPESNTYVEAETKI